MDACCLNNKLAYCTGSVDDLRHLEILRIYFSLEDFKSLSGYAKFTLEYVYICQELL